MRLSLGQRSPGDFTGERDAILLGDLVQYRDGSAVTQKNTLRVDGNGVVHFVPLCVRPSEAR